MPSREAWRLLHLIHHAQLSLICAVKERLAIVLLYRFCCLRVLRSHIRVLVTLSLKHQWAWQPAAAGPPLVLAREILARLVEFLGIAAQKVSLGEKADHVAI